jgi:coenzyme F420-reducing hydrogenase alpha subunit
MLWFLSNFFILFYSFLQILSISHLFGSRVGRGGGYKELDEEELEETKRRRKEAEEVHYSTFDLIECFLLL